MTEHLGAAPLVAEAVVEMAGRMGNQPRAMNGQGRWVAKARKVDRVKDCPAAGETARKSAILAGPGCVTTGSFRYCLV